MADEIEIVDYDASWPRLFEEERGILERALPSDQVLAIEHAGSTAIAGLAAKPIIDIFVAVPSIDWARATLVEPIERIGYVYWAENPKRDRMFFVKACRPMGSVARITSTFASRRAMSGTVRCCSGTICGATPMRQKGIIG